MSNEFFIGWQGKTSKKTGLLLKTVTMTVLSGALALAVAIPYFQRTVAEDAKWDLDTTEFKGILMKEPIPLLVGDDGSVHLLVNPLKYGFESSVSEKFHLKRVSLQGKLITRDDQAMIEVTPDSVKAIEGPVPDRSPLGTVTDFGEVTMKGEIVDSKCYLGVMNPGNLKPHRACAINCILGGVPPVLMVRESSGQAHYFILVGKDGRALNQEILSLVAEPVAATGTLKRIGKIQVLYLEPEQIVIE